jgi:hypothetical protein
MNFAQRIDFASLMEPVAARLLGEPNKHLSKPPKDVRYGNHGSLSVDLTAGRFFDHENNVGGGVLDLVKHHLGCDHSGAISWMRREGLIPGGPSSPQTPRLKVVGETVPPITAAYDYIDEDGVLLFQVVRYEPKTFRQRRPNDRDGWDWNLNGIRRVLYRLPELIQRPENAIVFICEGEKDTDHVRALGFAATTNAGGAGKWRSEYNASLRGADVVLVPHNDDTGRDHAEQVAAALNGIAGRIRNLDLAKTWPDCPEKGDISNWIEAGGTADQLKALVEALPDWQPLVVSDVSVVTDTWPQIDAVAYHGLAGEVVNAIGPHSEADPVAILIQFLALAGNMMGRTAYYRVEDDRHHSNLFAVLVGNSSKARKGTSMGRVRAITKIADQTWNDDRLKGGLSSGEGLINEVRDQRSEWNRKEGREEIVDPGVADKRLMIVEAEFASALAVMERQGSTLSPLIRRAWDGDKLATITRNSPLCATGAHISIIGHITIDELRARLTRTEAANGFANRFLFTLVRRSKELPFGGSLDESVTFALGERLREKVAGAQMIGRVGMTDAARDQWSAVYASYPPPSPDYSVPWSPEARRRSCAWH